MNLTKPNNQTQLSLVHRLLISGLAIALIVGGTSSAKAAENSALDGPITCSDKGVGQISTFIFNLLPFTLFGEPVENPDCKPLI